jgi:hypothetical protein
MTLTFLLHQEALSAPTFSFLSTQMKLRKLRDLEVYKAILSITILDQTQVCFACMFSTAKQYRVYIGAHPMVNLY